VPLEVLDVDLMLVFARACMFLAAGLAGFGLLMSGMGAATRQPGRQAAGRRALFALFAVLCVVMAVVEAAFARSDFSFRVVAEHSSTTTPLFYRLTAMWSSQEGSLLLWVWLLSGWSSLAVWSAARRAPLLAPWATAVLLAVAAFFLGLMLVFADPLRALAPAAAEGAGLEPLLRNRAMAIHPPMLYSGYTLAVVPLAFALSALITRRVDGLWVRQARRFALGGWVALTFGILLGAHWSWAELGWGGYWAWDPVENAALMPWLTGTAALHSLVIQEKRGTLRAWNLCLAMGTGLLAILGTFLVRSGVLESIHAFGASTLGVPFLVFIAVLLFVCAGLLLDRAELLRTPARLESLVSREAVFVLNNVVLVGLAAVIAWGTFFPLTSQLLTGTRATVGPPWFGRYTVPLAIAVVLLSGLGPLLAWRRGSVRSARRNLAVPCGAAALTGAGLAVAPVPGAPRAAALFCAAAFALAAVAQEYWRGTRARGASTGRAWPVALAGLVARNRRRYGGYLVHAGIALSLVGVAASSAFQHVRDARLKPGQSTSVAGYDVRYVAPTTRLTAEKLTLGAILDVRRGGRHVATLRPRRGYYPVANPDGEGTLARWFDGESTSEVGLDSSADRDLWTAAEPDLQPYQSMIDGIDKRFPLADRSLEPLFLGAFAQRYREQPTPVAFRVIVAPLTAWVWWGGWLAVLGGLIAIWPPGLRLPALARLPRRVPAKAV
jgi:cytochrome c-type biogenesis protein CcmF